MSIKRLLQLFVAVSVGLNTIALLLMLGVLDRQSQLVATAQSRLDSYRMGQEIMVTSDELTRLARTYVVTGDKQYKEQYWQIVDWVEGKSARPDGRTIAVRDLLKEYGFTPDELAKLDRSNELSLKLVETEEEAFNAVEGKYKDAAGNYTVNGEPDVAKATALVHDQRYHTYREHIMAPVQEFLRMVDQRTGTAVEAAVGSTHASAMALVGFLVAVIILAAVNYAVLLRFVIAPLDRLGKQAERVAAGERGVRLAEEGAAELGRVATTVNHMVDNLLRVVESVERGGKAVAQTSAEVSDAMARTHETVTRQKESINQVAAAATEMSATSHDMAGHCQGAASASGTAQQAVGEGRQVLARTIDVINELTREIEQSSDRIGHLEESVQLVTKVIDVINAIAEQTNLLALNAAIEAARAGDQGRGFAVVADEVRSLAQRTQQSTLEILQNIESLKGDTRQAVECMGSSTAKSGVVLEQASRASQCLQSISHAIDQINGMVIQIASAAEQQSQVADDIGRQANQIDALATDSVSLSARSLHASRQLDELATDLLGTVGR